MKFLFQRASVPRSTGSRRDSGIALVLVLGMLALIVILMVAFLGSVSSELRSAKTYASGLDAKSLADSAVNIVISQIQDATAAPQLAWASQPGMIRTYDNTGVPVAAFKLYSSDKLRVNGTFNPVASLSDEIPNDWAESRELFTDLNKPATVGGTNHYPVIDPSAVGKDTSGATALEGTEPPIEGCFLDTSKSAVAVSPNQTNPVPMPVRWLYVLKDGRITQMNGGSRKVDGASKNNPIVGRLAFWADDETCKVNVNTASEGTFWDRPWTASDPAGGYEASLYQSIPAQNEFQRYPGHPAMTCLSTVFPPEPDEVDAATGEPNIQYKQRIYGIVPRVKAGGSNSGTTTVNYLTPPVVADTNRLFASVDEFLFQVTDNVTAGNPRKANPKSSARDFSEDDIERTRFFITATSRAPEVNLFNKPRVTLWPLQANTGDVANPVAAVARNSKDKLIAFCSTIGSGPNAKPYYFQRYNTYDYTRNGPNDRGAGNYNPAQNPPPSSQSPVMDWEKIPRNQELYAYLQSLTAAPIPGLGGRLGGASGKYNPGVRDQILTEIMDFIRSNLNVTSTGIPTLAGGGYSYAPFNPGYSGNTGSWTGQFQIVPLSLPNGTKGFGNCATITQAALVFYRSDNIIVNGAEQTTPQAGYGASPLVTSGPSPRMRAFLILQPFTPTPGPPPWSANLRIRVEGLDKFAAGGAPMGFPADATNLVNARDGESNATALTGLELFTQYWPLRIKQPGSPAVGSPSEETFYPFVSGEVPLSGSTFNFTGGSITVKVYSGYAMALSESDLIQTIRMNFPDASGLPNPDFAYSSSVSGGVTTLTQYNELSSRFGALETGGGYGVQRNGQHNPLPLIRPGSNGAVSTGDTVRAVEARPGGPTRGDYRLIAAMQNVPEDYFEGRGLKDTPPDGRKYSDTAVNSRKLHSLRVDSGAGQQMTAFSGGYYHGSSTAGKLLAGANYYTATSNPNKAQKAPIAAYGLAQAEMSPGVLGDWDTGIGNRRDGPYVNKADLGNVGSNVASPTGYYNNHGFDRSANDAVVVDTGASFSPNRQVSSAVSFGSLPTGVDPSNPAGAKPWMTLLFCKNPLAGTAHPGFGSPAAGPPYTTPPDHVVLDFFTMPIVEPYAISEPFSTAGKVNMNYQIVPFSYLTRNTAVRAVLKSTRMMAIPTASAINYKYGANTGQNPNPGYPPDFRYTLNPDEATGTLAGFESRFQSGDIFRSASEICDIYLVPQNLVKTRNAAPGSPVYGTMSTWWSDYQLTGDNVREQPYGHLYPRLTTKSNTYTVHVMTQSLKKNSVTPVDEFSETRDQVTGEYRGSFIIERYLDPNADSLVKADGKTPATETDPDGMVGPYKFRIISSKRFAP